MGKRYKPLPSPLDQIERLAGRANKLEVGSSARDKLETQMLLLMKQHGI